MHRNVTRAVLSILTTTLLVALLAPTASARCGQLGKRPCSVLERIPSCDKGLVENLRTKRCEQKKKAKPQLTKPKPRALNCGKLNQRPCLVTERIPSCDKGLVENLRAKRCLKPAPKPVLRCGKLNQRPCRVTERVPSCDKGLVENLRAKRCLKPAPKPVLRCGKLNQRPCRVTERIPSCDKGLVEHLKKKRCVSKAKLDARTKARFDKFAGDFARENKRIAQALTRFGEGLMTGPTARYFKSGGFKRDLEKGRVATIVRNIDIASLTRSLKGLRTKYLPKTLMIGVVGEGGVGIGGSVELGIALDISAQGGNAVLYRTFGVSMGLITGGSASINLGLAWVRPRKIVGELRGFSFGAGKSVFQGASVGGSLGFWFQSLAGVLGGFGFDPRRFAGINIAVSVGATVLPVDFRGSAVLTQVLTPRGVWRADACGALKLRPCHVIERVPSCNRGLREDFGRHICIR